jgi:hypothetical protein
MKANTSYHQHEPLRPPASWNTSEKRFVAQLEEILDDLYRRFNRLRLEDMSPGYRQKFKSLQDGVSTFEQTAHNITAEVSSSQIYRAYNELELIATLSGFTPARTIEPGLIWYDMTNRLFKRCVSIEPTVWEVAETNALKTSYWEIRDDEATVGSSGSLDMLAGSRLNLRGPGFGISTDHPSGVLVWGGGDDPTTAPLAFYRDGTTRNGANIYVMSFATEAGPDKPMNIPLFFPADLFAIDKVLLYVRRKPFRATATGAASGGGSEKTSSSGGGATSGANNNLTGTGYASISEGGSSTGASSAANTGSVSLTANSGGDVVTSYAGTGATGGSSVSISGSTGYTSTAGSHNHAVGTLSGGSHTHTGPSHRHTGGAHTHGIDSHSHSMAHTHTFAHTHSDGGHQHTMSNHTHSIPSHTHTVTIDAHTHDLVYGIYEMAASGTFSVAIDGTIRRTGRSEETALDIADWFSKSSGKITRDTEHTILITPSALNRLEVQVMVKGAIVTKTIGSL